MTLPVCQFMSRSHAIVVSVSNDDPLARAFGVAIKAQGINVLSISPGALGDLHISLHDELFQVEGQPVSGIFFRASPALTFSEGFRVADQPFCDAEVRAAWLAALHLNSVFAVNQYDAVAWFEGIRWFEWRRRFIESQLPVSSFVFGDSSTESAAYWYPYTDTAPQSVPDRAVCRVLGSALSVSTRKQVSLVVDNQVISGEAFPTVVKAASLLVDMGIRLVEISTDSSGHILFVNTQPILSEPALVKRATDRLVGMYDAYLHNW